MHCHVTACVCVRVSILVTDPTARHALELFVSGGVHKSLYTHIDTDTHQKNSYITVKPFCFVYLAKHRLNYNIAAISSLIHIDKETFYKNFRSNLGLLTQSFIMAPVK